MKKNNLLIPVLLIGTLLLFGSTYIYMNFFQINNIGYKANLAELEMRRQFQLEEGYSANLFASEKDFDLGNVMSMTFDSKGRLWALTMPTYPHYYPGEEPHDKLLILEDTDGDGKADKQTVFADSLYLPTGFELGEDGVFVAQQSDLLFLKDTNGDDRADVKEIILHGFGTEDSHHSNSAFEWGPDGALYFHVGVFFHSQIETPYGPVRVNDGATFRYHPKMMHLEVYTSYPYANPWGQVFDQWGNHFIADASGGANYFANPMSGRMAYGQKHRGMKVFTSVVRPTCGVEFLKSRHFPEEVQGLFLVNNNIGFQGIKQHQVFEKEAGFESEDLGSFLQSSNPNFRPVDLQIGPDGALYVVDWYNPLIGHMQHSMRDSMRDQSHGRIWRITYNDKHLLEAQDLSKESINNLLALLDTYEDRVKYRARRALWQRPKDEVLAAVAKWREQQKAERLQLEALWLYQAFDQPNVDLLKVLLEAKEEKVRAAAVKILRYWKADVPDALTYLAKAIADDSPSVRMEAVVALTYFESAEAVELCLKANQLPKDYYLDYSITESLRYLRPYWQEALQTNPAYVDEISGGKAQLYTMLNEQELLALPSNEALLLTLIKRFNTSSETRNTALQQLATLKQTSEAATLLYALEQLEDANLLEEHPLVEKIMVMPKEDLKQHENQLLAIAQSHLSPTIQKIATALLANIRNEAPAQIAQKQVLQSIRWMEDGTRIKLFPMLSEMIKSNADSLKVDAIEALAFLPNLQAEKAEIILPIIQDTSLLASTTFALQSIYLDQLNADQQISLNQQLSKIAKQIPLEARDQAAFTGVVEILDLLQPLLPKKEQEEQMQLLQSIELQEVSIATILSRMVYNKEEIIVEAGKPVKITLKNPDVMPHNLVIGTPGSLEALGKAADDMVKETDAEQRQYIPDNESVLFYTPLVPQHQSYDLYFTAPEKVGNYPFLCTFPGHWSLMNGIIKVVEDMGNSNNSNQKRSFHLAVNRRTKVQTTYTRKHPHTGAKTLTNSIHGSEQYNDGEWLGFEGEDMVVEIDLGNTMDIEEVQVGALQNMADWIFMPTRVEVSIAEKDRQEFKTVGMSTNTVEAKEEGAILKNFHVKIPTQKVRYIKVHAQNRKMCPDWHPGAGSKAWIFIDEIVVK